jgi:hypothetical protein
MIQTHILTEIVSLSYWHGWLPILLFATAGAGAVAFTISTVFLPYIKDKRAVSAIALPEGARL